MDSLAPIFLLILLGAGLRLLGFVPDGFWPGLERTTYFVFFPCLLFRTTQRADMAAWTGHTAMVLAACAAVLVVAGLVLAGRRLLAVEGPTLSSIVQGSIRLNTYVGLALVAGLAGEEGLVLAAVLLTGMIPVVNLISVPAVAALSDRPGLGWRRLGAEILRNPLILACAAGFLVMATAVPVPGVATRSIDLLGRAALPVGLLAVGAGLQFSGLRGSGRALGVAAFNKLLLLPCLAMAACHLLGADPLARTVVLCFTAIPVAPSAFILARQLGGDARSLALMITTQTFAAFLTIPFLSMLFL